MDGDLPLLVAGLGNPGPRYAHTPHNIGFEVLDTFAHRQGLRFRRAFGLQALGVKWHGENSVFRLLKPQTFMNASGTSVRRALKRWKIGPDRLLLVYDDVELPLGTLRLRPRGGAGGHNGVTSVIRELDNLTDFPRLRLGVGPRPPGDRLIEYLLGSWDPERAAAVAHLRERGADALETILRLGVTAAMNELNRPGFSGAPQPEAAKEPTL